MIRQVSFSASPNFINFSGAIILPFAYALNVRALGASSSNSSIRKTIAGLAGGYSETAEILDVTEDGVHNRLRNSGDQLFPIGWSMVLQQAAITSQQL